MKKLAFGISAITHPLILLNLALFTLFRFHPYFMTKFYDEQFKTISIFIAVNTLVMPLLSIYLLKRFNYISDYSISKPEERILPYTLVARLLSLTTFQLYRNEIYGLPLVFFVATVVCIVFNLLINLKFKISSHGIALGGLFGLYLYLTVFEHLSVYNPFLIGSALLAGIGGWSRLYLNAHTEMQLYSGYLSGALITCFSCVFFA